MSHFLKMRAHELVPYQIEEDSWGSRPECPVEVLADGTRVWRVPDGTRVRVIGASHDYAVVVHHATRGGPPELVWVTTDGHFRQVYWTRLRRLDYTPAARVSPADEAAHAPR